MVLDCASLAYFLHLALAVLLWELVAAVEGDMLKQPTTHFFIPLPVFWPGSHLLCGPFGLHFHLSHIVRESCPLGLPVLVPRPGASILKYLLAIWGLWRMQLVRWVSDASWEEARLLVHAEVPCLRYVSLHYWTSCTTFRLRRWLEEAVLIFTIVVKLHDVGADFDRGHVLCLWSLFLRNCSG